MAIVVSDTSPLLALGHLGLLDLLSRLYSNVVIPTAVAGEIRRLQKGFLPTWIEIRAPSDLHKVAELRKALDSGESEAIALAIEIRADYLLIDEWAGRQVAASLGLTRVGALGVLLQAKKEGMISSMKPLVDRLRNEISFRVSDALYAQVLRDAGESE